jgi:pyrimidine dimer DNA glycosylase
MRLWTLHPIYLDPKGLVALWREALLAQRVLDGKTRGYRHHPQLLRFRECTAPFAAIGSFLRSVHAEAVMRGYSFDDSRIVAPVCSFQIEETEGQLKFEWEHLRAKLTSRCPEALQRLGGRVPEPNPLFRIVPGGIRTWERVP